MDSENEFIAAKIHKPLAISQLIYKRLLLLKKIGIISEEEFIVLDRNCNKLMDSLGGCERVKNTPIPFSYSLFIKKFIFIYVTTLPLAFVTIFGYFSAYCLDIWFCSIEIGGHLFFVSVADCSGYFCNNLYELESTAL